MGEEVLDLDNEGKSGPRGLSYLGTIRHNRYNRTNKSAQNGWEQPTGELWGGVGFIKETRATTWQRGWRSFFNFT